MKFSDGFTILPDAIKSPVASKLSEFAPYMPSIQFDYNTRDQLTDSLSQRTGFVWLHTRTVSGQDYEVIAFEPEWTLNEIKASDITNIQKIFSEKPENTKATNTLFNGGLIGYTGYDYSRQLPQNKPQNKPGVHSALLTPDLHFAYYPTNYIVVDHYKKSVSGHVADPERLYTDYSEFNDTGSGGWAARTKEPFRLTSEFSPCWTKDQYLQAYQRIKDYILEGDCYQVNLTQPLSAHYRGNPYSAFKKVLKNHRTPHFAYLETGKGSVLSFSPESFLSIENGTICTKPIKGTRKRNPDQAMDLQVAEELKSSLKDRAENVMIVDLLRNDLGRIAKTGSVRVSQLCELESFSNVHHLVSTIYAELEDGVTPLDALLTCSPGGSITGAPKIRAMEIIDELEEFPRNVYCGSVFLYSHHGHLESNIAIRTMTCREGYACLWGGGGIVADSDGEEEYRESLFKIHHIINELNNTLL